MQNELSERLLNFAADVIKLVIQLNKTAMGRYVSGQLMRASTSAGANYEEACGAESRADFIHKVQIAFKELKESKYSLNTVQILLNIQ
ncbi:MAG: four helix bundle protein [Candidatus Omnitrophota bacterium]